jgi:oligoendopeptidase F
LPPGEERVLAETARIAGSASNIFTVFSNADFPYPTVKLTDGTDVRLTPAAFAASRASANRDDRRLVMSTYFEALAGFGRTFGTTMNREHTEGLVLRQDAPLRLVVGAALDGSNIPIPVYTRLVQGVNRHLPTFHRYLRLRARMLGVSELHYYDLYAPLVASVARTYTPEEAQQHVLASLAPLGDEYVAVAARAFDERWIDLYPTAGKRSGAYSHGAAYDGPPVHPDELQREVRRPQHAGPRIGPHDAELLCRTRRNPIRRPITQSSLPRSRQHSTSPLLIDHMLADVEDAETRISLLGNFLESIKGTVFRQTQFAEFELRMHEMANCGEPVTGQVLADLYTAITRKYYGHDQGVCVVDGFVTHEWSFIPHFYREFYVFQYATSFTAPRPWPRRSGRRARYRRPLPRVSVRGRLEVSRRSPQGCGVDMTTDEPLDLTMAAMNRVMDEIEQLNGGLPRPV